MARWTRAARLLGLPAGDRVLDLGCAFGFGTRFLATRYVTYGHDLSARYIDRARRAVPTATFTCGPAQVIPYPPDFFDGVVFLDVLEHLPDEQSAIAEITRVLRVGGRMVLSVPNRGMLGWLDSLNLYERFFGPQAPAPTDDPSWLRSPVHRHYNLDQLQDLLGPHLRVTGVSYTGLGIAEPVNLVLLLFRRFRLWRLYELLQYLYFGVYLAEDLIPTGCWGYHLMVEVQRV